MPKAANMLYTVLAIVNDFSYNKHSIKLRISKMNNKNNKSYARMGKMVENLA